MGLFSRWRRQRVLQRVAIPADLWEAVLAQMPILEGLSGEEAARLRELSLLFLSEKSFEATEGIELDEGMRLVIAVQACLPILHLGLDWYDGWSAVIVYPAEFVPEREEMDEAGVVHHRREPLGGEAWERGPVILSWEDVESSGWRDGYNVVIHELTHKLDMLNGDPNGFPPLHAGMDPQAWSTAFGAAYADMLRRDEAGEETPIDPYALETPGECFAVFSEYFFERPDILHGEYPAVYAQLAAFYRQDPLSRFRLPA